MSGTAGKKNLRTLVLAAAAALFLTGCGSGAFADKAQSGTPEPSAPPAVEQPEETPGPADAPEQTAAEQPEQSGDAAAPQEVYRPIIDAYVLAQSSGFTSFADHQDVPRSRQNLSPIWRRGRGHRRNIAITARDLNRTRRPAVHHRRGFIRRHLGRVHNSRSNGALLIKGKRAR